MLSPTSAHHIPMHVLLGSLRGVDQNTAMEVRSAFARWLVAPANWNHETWQEAWNQFIGATPGGGPVRFNFTPQRCSVCGGRGYSDRNVARNMARTGHPMGCGECRSTGRGTQQTYIVYPMPVPTSD